MILDPPTPRRVARSAAVLALVSQLSGTGGSTLSHVVLSALMLIFSRIAMLLGRTPRVRTDVPR